MFFIMAIVNINKLKKEVGCAFTPLLQALDFAI